MRRCVRCGNELPFREDDRDTRRYCSASCRQRAYFARLSPAQRIAQLARKAITRKRRGGNQ